MAVKKIAFAALVALLASSGVSADSSQDVQRFAAFKAQYSKSYASGQEETKRFKIFVQNLRKAESLSQANPLARFGVNAFADLSETEFKTRHNAEKHYAAAAADLKKLPTAESPVRGGKAMDWRQKGAVTPVKNQGQCGSCWSFSTTGGIEGQWFLAGNALTSLSEQEFVSCDTNDSGCNGGLMDNAYKWVLAAHKGSIVTEASYPYVSGGGQVPACDMKNRKFGAQIDGFKNIAKNEDKMADFVFTSGPLSIAVDATSWQTYQGGIMTNCISTQIDHGVLIVGFDDNNSPPYWIVKNSWGPGWGEEGYIRIEKGTNQCLITSYPCSATVAKAGPTPVTPAPAGPAPVTPAPAGPTPPSKSSFTQKKCKDPKCQDCTKETFAQDKCIATKFGSYKARCATDALIAWQYTSKDCSGAASVVSNPVNQCSIVFGTEDEFIMNECAAPAPGPGPQPPQPPTPTPPAPTPPTPPTATFTQMVCQDASCQSGCANHTFPQNTCLRLNGGGSAKAKCSATDITLTEYPLSTDCTGASIPSAQPIDKCLKGNGGNYFENFCSGTGAMSASAVQKQL